MGRGGPVDGLPREERRRLLLHWLASVADDRPHPSEARPAVVEALLDVADLRDARQVERIVASMLPDGAPHARMLAAEAQARLRAMALPHGERTGDGAHHALAALCRGLAAREREEGTERPYRSAPALRAGRLEGWARYFDRLPPDDAGVALLARAQAGAGADRWFVPRCDSGIYISVYGLPEADPPHAGTLRELYALEGDDGTPPAEAVAV